MLFYIYCIKMNRPKEEFYYCTFRHVMAMIDMYTDEKLMESHYMKGESYNSKYFNKSDSGDNVKTITSLKEIEGW